MHLGIDAQTMEIHAVEVTPNSVGDAPVLPALLGQIDSDEMMLSASGDGAYGTKACHKAITLREAQAIIPVCKNASKHWRRTVLERGRETRSCALRSDWAARSGSAKADITGASWSWQRCFTSN